jgi:hypothetical protein
VAKRFARLNTAQLAQVDDDARGDADIVGRPKKGAQAGPDVWIAPAAEPEEDQGDGFGDTGLTAFDDRFQVEYGDTGVDDADMDSGVAAADDGGVDGGDVGSGGGGDDAASGAYDGTMGGGDDGGGGGAMETAEDGGDYVAEYGEYTYQDVSSQPLPYPYVEYFDEASGMWASLCRPDVDVGRLIAVHIRRCRRVPVLCQLGDRREYLGATVANGHRRCTRRRWDFQSAAAARAVHHVRVSSRLSPLSAVRRHVLVRTPAFFSARADTAASSASLSPCCHCG